jgi:hypothetical protein
MTSDPDPLANNPAIQKWAARFYAVKAWDFPLPVDGSDDLTLRRKAATEALGKITIGADLMPGARRAFDGGRKAIRAAVTAAVVADDFDLIDQEIIDLAKDIAAQGLVAKARALSASAVAAAEAKFAAVSGTLDEGAFTLLNTRLIAAKAGHRGAVSKDDFDAAAVVSGDYLTLCTQAEGYGAYFDSWAASSLAYIAKTVALLDRPASLTLRETQMKAATVLSGAGDFTKAKEALQVWNASGAVAGGKFDDAQKFFEALSRYTADHHETCQEVLSSGIEGVKSMSGALKSAKTLAYGSQKYAEATVKLQGLIDWAEPRKALALHMRRFDPAMQKEKAYREAMTKMNGEQVAGKFSDAIATLTTLEKNKALMEINYSSQISKKLKKRYEALTAVISGAEKQDLEDTWKAHEDFVQKSDFAQASLLVPRLHALFRMEKMVDLRAEAARINSRYPAAAGYGYLTGFDTLMGQKKYTEALKTLQNVMPALRLLPDYLDAKAELEGLVLALPVDPADLRLVLTDALAEAEKKARASDAGTAAGDLRAVMSGADYLGLALELTDYSAKLADVSKRHPRVRKLLGLGAAEKAIDDSLAAARALADPGARYAEAYLAMAQHETLLTLAQSFGAARRQVLGVIGGLRRAEKATPGMFDSSTPTLDALELDITAAEKLAAQAKFAEAEALFNKVLKDSKGLNTAAAAQYEALDSVGSNAGHSIDRHGADLHDPSNAQALIDRLKTGTPPNAKTPDEKSYTGASSCFKDPADWLAGRELAAQAAEKKGADLTATEIKPPFDAQLDAVAFTVEHGKAIDKAFIGKKKKPRFDEATSEFIPDKTYETFEEIGGLTRAYVNFLWEFPVLADVPKLDKDKKPMLSDTGAAVLGDHKAQDIEDYVAAFTRKTGTAPTSIPGRWVMMQQYPVADGWDDTLKAYTSDPMDMIP